MEKGNCQIFLVGERKVSFWKNRDRIKEKMGSFGRGEVFGQRGLAVRIEKEKENKVVVAPPEKGGTRKEGKQRRIEKE